MVRQARRSGSSRSRESRSGEMFMSEFIGRDQHEGKKATVYFLSDGWYAAQAWDGTTSFRLGEFESEQEAENAAEDYVRGDM